jgi:RHS repeat-associated protein
MDAGRSRGVLPARARFWMHALAAAAALGLLIVVVATASGPTEPYTTYETTITADTPATQYRFDDAVGATSLADSAGTRTATNTSITLGGTGPFGGSKSGAFNGTSSVATLPSTPLSAATAFTAEAWVNWAGGASYNQHVFDLGSSTSKYMFLTPASSATNHPLRFEIRSSNTTVFDADATTLSSGAWHYIAVTESGTTLTLYLDGAQVATKTGVSINPKTLGATNHDYLGKSQTTSDPLFHGSLSNVAFYSTALSATQIQNHWNAANFPVNTALPQISGTTTDGQTLTTTDGTWSGISPITFGYQWQRCDAQGANCADVSGATNSTYPLTGPDVGSTLEVKVKGTNSAGNSTASSAQTATVQPAAPHNTALPSVSGTARDGQVLAADKGTWSGTTPISYAYQWERCDASGSNCAVIAGAQSASYTLGSQDVAQTVRVTVTAANSTGSESKSSSVTGVVAGSPPANSAPPSVSGAARDGQTLTADKGTWAGTTPIAYAYQWQRCDATGASCADIAGATSTSYTVSSSDVGNTLRVSVNASNTVTTTTVASAVTSAVTAAPPSDLSLPSITGSTTDGSNLTADKGSWGGTSPITYSYQWQRCDGSGQGCSNIAGATTSSYALGAADDGNELRVKVTATNQGGSAAATSPASNVITPAAAGTCTDVWNGRAGDGEWGTAGNWSASRVPNSSDRACAGTGTAIHVPTATVGSIFSQGSLNVTSYALTISDTTVASSVADLSLSGTLIGAGTLTVMHGLTWSAGGADRGGLVLGASAVGTINTAGGSAASIDSTTLTNQGTLTITGGALAGTNGAAIVNSGTLNVNSETSGAHGLTYGGFGAIPQVTNTGTMGKTSGSSYSQVDWGINNQGTIDTTSGTLRFGQGGTHTTNASSTWIAENGAANELRSGPLYDLGRGVQVSGALKTYAPVTAGDIHGVAAQLTIGANAFTLSDSQTPSDVADLTLGETASGNPVLTGAGTLTVNRTLTWKATAAVRGNLVLSSLGAGTVDSTGGSAALVDGGSFTNQGTVTVAAGALAANNAGRIQNAGTLTVNSETSGGHGLTYGGAGAVGQITNTGTLQKTTGSSYSQVDWTVNNQGTISTTSGTLRFTQGGTHTTSPSSTWFAAAGAANELNGPTYDLGAAAQVHGTLRTFSAVSVGQISGGDGDLDIRSNTVTVSDSQNGSTLGSLELNGGTLTGAGALSLTQSLTWHNGSMFGTGSTTLLRGAAGTVSVDSGGAAVLDTRTLRNYGSLALAQGRLIGGHVATLDNESRLYANSEVTPDAMGWQNGNPPVLINNGTVTKNVGTGTTVIAFQAQGSGTYYQQTGTLAFSGYYNAPAPTVIGSPGNPATAGVALTDGTTSRTWDGGPSIPLQVHATGNVGVDLVKLIGPTGSVIASTSPDCSDNCPTAVDTGFSVPSSVLSGVDTTVTLDAESPAGVTATQSIDLLDPTPTDTTVLSGPAPTSASSTAAFTFASSISGYAFQCEIDDSPWQPCPSPVSYSGLADGVHSFAVQAVSPWGFSDPTPATRSWTVDTTPPDTVIDHGPDPVVVSDSASFDFSSPEPGSTFECQLDGGAWSACPAHDVVSGLADGSHTLGVRAVDVAGNRDASPATATWQADPIAPLAVLADGPTEDSLIDGSAAFSFTVNKSDDTTDCRLDDGAWAACTSPVNYSNLPDGKHTFEVRATDGHGVVQDPPATRSWTAQPAGPDVTIGDAPAAIGDDATPTLGGTAASSDPAGDASTTVTVKIYSGTGAAGNPVRSFDTTRDGTNWELSASAWDGQEPLADGAYAVRAEERDIAGNVGRSAVETFTVDSTAPEATASQDAFPTDVSFLYSGDNPVQTGVAPGTIDASTAGVIRGHAQNADGTPAGGASVTVVGHPEYGQTETQAGGDFFIAVNGGGSLTVRITKAGKTSVDRTVDVPQNDYAWVDLVVLLSLDSSTPVEFAGGIDQPVMDDQVVQSTASVDGDGERQATLIFTPGTAATMTLPDGSTQSLTDTAHVRATEYTVGANGPAAMPGDLPATSAYTYAVDYTIDEAQQAGATGVSFDRPVYSYTENFLGFDVGTQVPSGYYDRARAIWVAAQSGVVIKIVGVDANGAAEVDADGDGNADAQSSLNALGFSDLERKKLAALYPVGKTLWRVPLQHFSSYDYNDPPTRPANSIYPPGGGDVPNHVNGPCHDQGGSTIDCENQAVEEQIPLAGTGLSLHYQSDRTMGYKALDRVDIPISPAAVPDSLRRIDVELSIAGRQVKQSFPAEPNERFTYTWDGKDVFGRTLDGRTKASVTVSYVYSGYYGTPLDPVGFGAYGSADAGGLVPVRAPISLSTVYTQWVGSWNAEEDHLGGWTLSASEHLDRDSGSVYEPDGTVRSGDQLGARIDSVATGLGDYRNYIRADGLRSMARTADGTIYVTDSGANRVWRIAPDGSKSIAAQVQYPTAVAVAPDGSLYVASLLDPDTVYGQTGAIYHIGSDGSQTRVAGGGTDQSAAVLVPTSARLGIVSDIEVGPSGGIYFAQKTYNYPQVWVDSAVREITPDGRLVSITNLHSGARTLGGPASAYSLVAAEDLAFGRDGSLYVSSAESGYDIADEDAVFRITPDGKIHAFAGNNGNGDTGDGGLATDARTANPTHIAIGPDGTVYISEDDLRIRAVGADGTIRSFAGTGSGDVSGDGGAAATAGVPGGPIVSSPNGDLYTLNHGELRRIHKVFGGEVFGATDIASENGATVTHFDAAGLERTVTDADTGDVLETFGYDDENRLKSVTDGDGNTVMVERDSAGSPTAIVGPFGERTTLGLDANGYLQSASSPIDATHNQTWALTYHPGGLLATMTDPNNGVSSMEYDSLGRLTRDEDAAHAVKTLVRTADATGFQVGVTTEASSGAGAMTARTHTARIEALPSGDLLRTFTDPSGLQTKVQIGQDGTTTTTTPDGTVSAATPAPDPRFSMQSPILKSARLTTPGGRSLSVSASRQVALTNADDPSTMTSETDTLTVNGKSSSSAFDATTRRYTATSASGRTEKTDVDGQGRIIRDEVPGITPVTFAYGFRGLLTQIVQGGRTVTYAYETDSASPDYGRVRSVTDSLDHTTTFQYDKLGRVSSETLPDNSTIAFAYDADGNVTSVTPPGRPAHNFTPTPIGLTDTYTAPDAGDASAATHYDYNPNRQLTRVTEPSGNEVDLGYDAGGRLHTITAGSDVTTYDYDPSTGQPTTVTAPSGEAVSLAFDGPLATSASYSGPVPGAVSYEYDSFLRPSQETVAGTQAVSLGYDDDGLLTSAGPLTLTYDQRDSQGAVNARNGLPTATALGSLTTSTGFNGFAEPTSLNASYGASSLYSATLSRDNGGRITTKTETVPVTDQSGNVTGSATHSYGYGYDAAGHLTDVTRDGQAYAHYDYGVNGSRSGCSGHCQLLAAPTYDDQDRLRTYGTLTYHYSPDGELATKTDTSSHAATSYGWDGLGNLTSVELPGADQHIEYVFGPGGERIGKKVAGQLVEGFIYGTDSAGPVAETDGQGNVTERFVYASDDYTPDYIVKGGHTYRLITDERGSVRLVVDTANGSVAEQLDYDEFGRVLADSNPGFQPFGFAGGMWDSDTGLLHLGAREYDPETGRFISKDPLGFDGGDTNLYGYALADPVNLVDPSGLNFIDKVGGTIGSVIPHDVSTFSAGVLDGAFFNLPSASFGIDPNCWGSAHGAGQFVGAVGGGAVFGGVTTVRLAGEGAGILGWAGAGAAGGAVGGVETTGGLTPGATPGQLVAGGIAGIPGGMAGGSFGVLGQGGWAGAGGAVTSTAFDASIPSNSGQPAPATDTCGCG